MIDPLFMKPGDMVIYHTGSYGSEQGQASPSWWPEKKIGKIIRLEEKKTLIEFKDGEREWAQNYKLEKSHA